MNYFKYIISGKGQKIEDEKAPKKPRHQKEIPGHKDLYI